MSEFDELDAMRQIAAALEPLDDAARARALRWAISRFHNSRGIVEFEPTAVRQGDLASGDTSSSTRYRTLAELFDAAAPVTERDKALLAAYWIQIIGNEPNFPAQSLNDLLKDLGHRIGNITEALNALKNERPALVLQLKKSGSTRQARKTYKMTQEGAKRVAAMTNDPALFRATP